MFVYQLLFFSCCYYAVVTDKTLRSGVTSANFSCLMLTGQPGGSVAATLAISSNVSESELYTKPSIFNLTDVINISVGCCLHEGPQRVVLFCDDLVSLIHVLNETADLYANESQLVFYLGVEEKSTEFTISNSFDYFNFNQVFIIGYGDVTIVHGNRGPLVFFFVDVLETNIQHISFRNGGIAFKNCKHVHLADVHIRNSVFGGCAFSITATDSDIVSFNLFNCSFIQNGNVSKNYGGLSISIVENYAPIVVRLINCQFYQNFAQLGGAVSVVMANLPVIDGCQNLVPIFDFNNCSFKNNHAMFHGGAVYFESYSGSLYGLVAYKCLFVNNSALHSGGAFYSTIRNYGITCDTSNTLVFYECMWQYNSAKLSAAIILQSTQPFRSNVTMKNNTVRDNYGRKFSFGGQTYCIIYCNGLNMTLADTEFLNNRGSAFCSENSKLLVQGMVVFSSNKAYLGGGVYLDQNAWISLENKSYLVLKLNKAVYGGGLYQTTLSSVNNICFIEKQLDSTIMFADNYASNSGSDMYFLTPSEACQQELISISYTIGSGVSSSAYYIELANDFEAGLMLGQRIVFNASVTDFFGNASSTFVNLFLLPSDKDIFEYNPYNLTGFTSFAILNGTNSPDVYLLGPDNSTTNGSFSLVISTSQVVPQITKTFHLNILSCVLGFSYVPATGACVCGSDSSDLHCDLSTGIACVRKGYWYGQLESVGITAPCSSGKCKNIANSCEVCASNGFTTFCQLPKSGSEECTGNFAGVLCSECLPGYAYTFQAQQCVKSSTCTNAASLIPSVLMITYLLIVIGIIFIVLKLGYHVRSGYMYCIVYYFSIVKLVLPKSVISTTLEILVSVFQSILQLDPFFLGYIPVCVSPKVTILEQKMLLFINPLIVTAVILSIIGLSRCRFFSRYIRFEDNSFLKAISLLALLSFTTLTETSFNIITPIRYSLIDATYVKAQPFTKYLDPTDHLAWWMIAVLVMGAFVIPFTFLLLFAPILIRCFNLNKIKPFLDEFQGCYKDQYRWMAGYYFICRIIFFLCLSVSVAEGVNSHYTALIFSIFVMIFHMLLQPYQDKWLNVIDSVLLADLVFIALLYIVSSEIAFEEIESGQNIRQTFTYLLVAVPIIYIISIIAYALIKKLPAPVKQKVKMMYSKEKARSTVLIEKMRIRHTHEDINDSFSENPLIPTTEIGDFSRYREPLLESFSDNNTANYNLKSPQVYSSTAT